MDTGDIIALAALVLSLGALLTSVWAFCSKSSQSISLDHQHDILKQIDQRVGGRLARHISEHLATN